uniref:Venom peptide n=1 Tax=Caenorhabditis tropicalis TaxID=1561998 RepID=A0A1I7THV6_9PELO
MRTSVSLFLLLVSISIVSGQYDSGDSSNSADSLEQSSSSEQIIGSEEIIIEEGSGSGDVPVISVEQIHVFGILPGPGDIRKKRGIMDILQRK